jgi:uncharacterized protein with von Willebrand factor type A (vWA) domain
MAAEQIQVTHLTLDLASVSAAFTRTLYDAGLPVSSEQAVRFARALSIARPISRRRLYYVARAVLAADRTQFAAFDAAFAAVFGRGGPGAGEPPAAVEQLPPAPRSDTEPSMEEETGTESPGSPGEPGSRQPGAERSDDTGPEDARPRPVALLADAEERLLDRRFEALTTAELAELNRLIARLALAPPLRRRRRTRGDRRGEQIDLRRTLRGSRRTGGEPIRLSRRRRSTQRRRLVMLCDISGSMEPYARAYLQFLAAGGRSGSSAEAFVFATRLTRVTRSLRTRSPQAAIARAAATAPDWSSGTRIGSALKTFNDCHGRRGMARGAVVVIISDGWECGDPKLVAIEMERLARLAYRIVWVNPRVAASGFAPHTGGMRAAIEHCDALLSGHTLRALHDVVDVIAAARTPISEAHLAPGTVTAADGEAGDEEGWPSATPVAGSSVAMPSGYGPSRGRTTPGWSVG